MLDDELVDLGPLALGHQTHGLAGLGREFAHEPRQALEHRANRLRPDRHDAFLDVARQLLQFVEAVRHGRVLRLAQIHGLLVEHGLVDDELAGEVDQPVDAVELDPDGGAPRFR